MTLQVCQTRSNSKSSLLEEYKQFKINASKIHLKDIHGLVIEFALDFKGTG